MELYGHSRNGSHTDQWATPGQETGLEESMMRLGLLGREFYPERGGVPNCAYYMRTGSCGYGNKCRYNHPRDRNSAYMVQVGGVARTEGGEFPERIGEPECQYYLRTGTCKFGATCKFHHPRNGGGSLSNVPVNVYGYPLRPGEKECSYYLKTGQCKFGLTCKFNHPQLLGVSVPASVSPYYPTVQSSPPPEQYGGATSYRVPRPPLLPGSYVSGAYGPLLLPQGVMPIPNWSPYSGPVSPVMSPGAQTSSVGPASLYGVTPLSSSAPAFAGPYAPFPSSVGLSSNSQTQHRFPERPGQPECQYYMKNGDCKFGSSCKYHHPPDWAVSKTNCILSHVGLPLRPGVQPCSFYLQNKYCKFGQTCKFDHPVGAIRYSTSASSLNDMTIAPYMLQSTPTTLPFPELQPEYVSGSNLDSHLT
ncbi:Zinc finger CCCH domain-containing protein 32 [Heracleum sosnowskyi]|uniref:Zinc finger CCCH domain-containing protein 32 n=1 Tax=Heracleum sosnowskyi TaxID=360622 RepID=A0AAD8M1A0_9APIA|nr:Zinc finger CCCH domain-containing protein 32 [Heracleum sosnowskyi]